nr:endonuclease III [Raoultella sp. NCTC 9187]
MNKSKRLEILTRLRDNDPHPTTELNFSSPFELLISVLLSAQATDVSVNKATAKLYPVANTPAAMLDLGVDGVKSYIKTIGLFNSKAENVIKTCRILLEQHNGEVRRTEPRWKRCPASGAKPPTWCSIPPSAGRRLRSTRIFSACATDAVCPG